MSTLSHNQETPPARAPLAQLLPGLAIGAVALVLAFMVRGNAAFQNLALCTLTVAGAATIFQATRSKAGLTATWRGGWNLVALGLLARAIHHALLWIPDAGVLGISPSRRIAGLFLLAQPILLWCGLMLMARPATRTERVARAFDSLLLGGSVATLVWWLFVQPALPQWIHPGWMRPGAALANSAALVLAALGAMRARDAAAGRWMMAAAILGLAAADFLFANHSIAVPVAVAAPIVLAMVALSQVNRASNHVTAPDEGAATNEQIDDFETPGEEKVRPNSTPFSQIDIMAESGDDEREAGRRWMIGVLAAALPALATLVGILQLANAPRRAGGALDAWWWAPILVGLAGIRHVALSLRQRESLDAERARAAKLQETVKARTDQLALVHSAAADLGATLDGERVLVATLDQMSDVSSAEAGAVWLRTDFQAPHAGGEATSNASGITNQAFLRRHSEHEVHKRPASQNGWRAEDKEKRAARGNEKNEELAVPQPRWRLVRAQGFEGDGERRTLNLLNEALERGGAAHCAQVGGAQENFAAHVTPIRSDGEVIGAFAALRHHPEFSVTERVLLAALADQAGAALHNAQLYQEARRRADIDSVTDLLNHRSIGEKLEQALIEADSAGQSLTLVMMDLNNFKFFNDTYGHPVGDQVLRIVARSLGEICRTNDVIGRYGGDEFIALLADTDAQGALEVCSRIAARVENEPYSDTQGRQVPIGLSFGAAVFPQDGQSAMDLLSIADANLYEAKRGGAPATGARNAEENPSSRQIKEVGTGGSFGVLDALVTAIDNKDHYTRRHSEDVTHWASLMARELEYSSEVLRAVRICGLLHDVGKIAVPDAILTKSGRLEDDEFQIVQQHPVFGALIVKDVPNLNEVLGGVRHHHERFDGKGYPDKMSGEDIPLLGRILAVPDCFSAMTTERPYRQALSWSEAIDEIKRGRGTQFDPQIADAFLTIIERIVAGDSAKSFDKNGTRHSVLQLPKSDTERRLVARPRSVADVDASMQDID